MRSVVVVLPASMCAMIPMFRVLSRENLRGISQSAGGRGSGGCGQRKRAPRARAHDKSRSQSRRYVLEVSMLAQRATRLGARVSGALRGAGRDDSKGLMPDSARLPTVLTLRLVLTVTGVAG